MYYLNKIVGAILSPLGCGLLLALLPVFLPFKSFKRLCRLAPILAVAWLWFWSTGAVARMIGLSLERTFPPAAVESLPDADAIAVLGGGVGGNTNMSPYAEMFMAADRVAHAARIWKAGKAPVIIPSGYNEAMSSLPLLKEFGLPTEAILVENKARNTEENAKYVAEFVKNHRRHEGSPKVLLVTSSWHMRRSLLMFRKYAPDIEVIPAACDYEATVDADRPLDIRDFVPSAEALLRTSYMLKEYLGYWGYRWLRR